MSNPTYVYLEEWILVVDNSIIYKWDFWRNFLFFSFLFFFHVFKRWVTRVYWKHKEFPAVQKESTSQALRIISEYGSSSLEFSAKFFFSRLSISDDTESELCVRDLKKQ